MLHEHNIIDNDVHFIISDTGEINLLSDNKDSIIYIQQFLHLSESFTFEAPRYIEGHDMSLSNIVNIHFTNIDSKTKKESKDIYPVDGLKVDEQDENKIIFTCKLKDTCTRYVGLLKFSIIFECYEDDVVIYRWPTDIFSKIMIRRTNYNSGSIVIEHSDIISEIQNDIKNIKSELNIVGDISKEKISEAVNEYLTANPIEETDPTVPEWAKSPQKPTYTASEVGADATGTAESKVSAHNVSDIAHNDIRLLVQGLTERLNALADSDDTTLDQMSEIVAYIKSNKSLIDAITTGKVSTSDIVDNLTTNAANRPLSAAQGVVLKAMIDGIDIPSNTSDLTNDSGFVELDNSLTDNTKAAPAGIVGGLKSDLNNIKNQIAGGSGGGLSTDAVNNLITILRNAYFREDFDSNTAIGNLAMQLVGGSGGDAPVDPTPQPTIYTVAQNLTNVSSSNGAVTAKEGTSFTTTLTVGDDYTLESVLVTMGSTNITSTAYTDATGVVSIASVTGNIVITANASEKASEWNMIQQVFGVDKLIYGKNKFLDPASHLFGHVLYVAFYNTASYQNNKIRLSYTSTGTDSTYLNGTPVLYGNDSKSGYYILKFDLSDVQDYSDKETQWNYSSIDTSPNGNMSDATTFERNWYVSVDTLITDDMLILKEGLKS